MRQAAFNLLEVNGVRVEFVMPEPRELARINLTSDRRRQILLLFKEAITNIARHAHASSVRVELSLQPRRLALTIDDDGRGFDPAGVVGGHGLHGLAQRAAELGGAFDLSSRPGSGTQVRLTLPL
jgi:signal transduction histidine kinase